MNNSTVQFEFTTTTTFNNGETFENTRTVFASNKEEAQRVCENACFSNEVVNTRSVVGTC